MSVQYSIKGSTAVEISTSIESAIRRRSLAPDAPLPTVRACAETLGVSPATVASAYRILRDRGLIVTRGRRGTAVSPQPPVVLSLPTAVPRGVRDLANGNPDRTLLPELEPALAAVEPRQRLYGEPMISTGLIDWIRRDLARDGIDARQVSIVSGALDGLERVMQVHLRQGDPVAVEDPAFTGTMGLLHAAGHVPIPVEVDDFGMLPSALGSALSEGARAVVITPRAQNPTGAALTAERADALRDVLAAHPEVLVLEDDHAGPVCGADAVTLTTGRERWAIARSFSKALGPDLRVAALAGDELTIARVEGRQLLGMRWVSHILQELVLTLLRSRGMKSTLRDARVTYTRRRRALIEALAERGIEATGRSGLNVWIPVPEESAVVSRLLEMGWAVSAGERFRIATPPGIRVTTASLPEQDAPAFAEALAAALTPASLTLAT